MGILDVIARLRVCITEDLLACIYTVAQSLKAAGTLLELNTVKKTSPNFHHCHSESTRIGPS
jgi:hypothetical protein